MKFLCRRYFFDKGDPIDWPLYRLRLRVVRRWPQMYAVMWGDFR